MLQCSWRNRIVLTWYILLAFGDSLEVLRKQTAQNGAGLRTSAIKSRHKMHKYISRLGDSSLRLCLGQVHALWRRPQAEMHRPHNKIVQVGPSREWFPTLSLIIDKSLIQTKVKLHLNQWTVDTYQLSLTASMSLTRFCAKQMPKIWNQKRRNYI